MATPVAVEFTVEGLENVKAAFGELSSASKATSQSFASDSKAMQQSLRLLGQEIFVMAQTGRLIAEFGEQFGFLDKKTSDAIAKTMNLISMMGGLASSLSTLTRLLQSTTAAEWALVFAQKARAIASAIAHALAGPTGWALLAGAAAAAGIGLALAGKIPEASQPIAPRLQYGGIPFGLSEQRGRTIYIDIHDVSLGDGKRVDASLDVMVDRLRRAGVI